MPTACRGEFDEHDLLWSILQMACEVAAGGGGGGGGITMIDGPVVTTFNDSRGTIGDHSYDPATGLMWMKIDNAPHTWVNWTVADE